MIKYLILCLGVCSLLHPARAQQLPPTALTGRIYGADHQPLSGASLTLRGARQTWQAAAAGDGHFSFAVPAGTYTLRVNFVGYQSLQQELALPRRDSLLIILPLDTRQLNEVKITTGYQELPKERATGAFVQVDRQLLNRAVSTDILDRLRDIVPGLSFNRIGTRLSVRGQSTLFANAYPLIVVDGFPYNEPIENLNPNDVESVTVLKDAAAASIWGSRAGNGVIVITTRNGRYNQPLQLNFNGSVQLGQRPDLFQAPRMSTGDYIDLEQKLFQQNYFQGTETGQGHYPLSPVVELLIARRDGKLSTSQLAQQLDALRSQDVRHDLQQYFYRPSLNQQYNLNLSGGTLNQQYYFSVGRDQNRDNLSGNGYARLTLNGRNTWKLLQNKMELSAGLYLSESRTTRDNPGALLWNRSTAPVYPYAQLADANGEPLPLIADYRADFVNQATANGLLDWQYRPLQELALADNLQKIQEQRLTTSLKYRLVEGLQAELRYQYDRSEGDNRNLHDANSYYTRNLVNRYTQVNNGTLSRPLPVGGIADLGTSDTRNEYGRLQLNYEYTWAEQHELTAIAGYELQSQQLTGRSYRWYGYDVDHAASLPVDGVGYYSFYDNPAAGNTIPLNLGENRTLDHYRSYYANAAWTYDRRLTLSGSARLDQSNLFGVATNQKGVPLWSAGLAWTLSRERWYRLTALPELKLRLTYGYNGNVNKSLSAYTTATYFDGSDAQTLLPYARIINAPNDRLRWERVRNINLGVDFSCRDQRLSGSLEYFIKQGLDLIGTSPYAPSSGITTFTGNTASTTGHGFDLNLESRNLTGRLRWTSNLIAGYYRDRVTSYSQTTTPAILAANAGQGGFPVVGHPLYALYSYAWAGLNPQTGDPQGYLNGSPSTNYNAILAAATLDNLIYSGPARPTLSGGLRNTWNWEAFSLSANISYALGYVFRRSSVRYGNDNGLSQQSGDYALSWRQAGDEQYTQIPSVPASPNTQRDAFYSNATVLIAKGDHLRLADVQLSYQLPVSTLRSLPGLHLQCYLYASNLGILWRANREGLDPDYANTFTPPRTLAVGLRLTY